MELWAPNSGHQVWWQKCLYLLLPSKTGFYYIDQDPQGEEFDQLVSGMKDRSIFKYDVDVTDSDEIVTLSTCTYRQTTNGNGRFVVMGRLLRDEEQIPTIAKFLDSNTISISVT